MREGGNQAVEPIPERKAWVIEAATRIFSQKGFHSTNMREIAEEAKVAIGTIYHYFQSKEEILIEIFRQEMEERKRFLEELRKSGLSILEQIKKVLEMHFNRIKENKELVKLLLIERLEPTEKLKKELQLLYEEVADYIEAIVREGISKKDIEPCNPTIAAYAVLGVIESVTSRAVLYEDEKAATILREAPQELARSLSRWLSAGPRFK